MTQKKRENAGKIASDLQKKAPDTRDPIELQREMQENYEKYLVETIESGKKAYEDPFYVVVEMKKERLLQNIIRNYFIARQSCPTPFYDQTVYRIKMKEDRVDLLWVIPSKDTCEMMKEFALEVAPTERILRDYVLAYYDGSLLTLCRSLNGELEETKHDRARAHS